MVSVRFTPKRLHSLIQKSFFGKVAIMNILFKNVKIPKNPVDLSAISEMLKYASLGICAFSYTSVGSGVPSPKYHVALTILNASGEVSISSASSSVSMVYF